jgi:hypothetical protein
MWVQKGKLTLGIGEVALFGFPGIGMLLIFDRTSVPDSIERFKMRTMTATPDKNRKTRRFPRSKPAIALRFKELDQLYIIREREF